MSRRITVRRQGDEFGVSISKEMATLMNLRDGDQLQFVETDHGYALVPAAHAGDDADSPVLAAFEDVLSQYDDTLRRLAQ